MHGPSRKSRLSCGRQTCARALEMPAGLCPQAYARRLRVGGGETTLACVCFHEGAVNAHAGPGGGAPPPVKGKLLGAARYLRRRVAHSSGARVG